MDNQSDSSVNRVAIALFKQSIQQARKESSNLKFDMSDSITIFRKLSSETDTGIAIITSAYFDECLKNIFTLHLGNISKKDQNSLFDFNGPLGTFSSRIRLSHALNFISNNTNVRLNAFRKIRNDFAHKPFGFSFNQEDVKKRISDIDVNHKVFMNLIRKQKDIRKVTKPP